MKCQEPQTTEYEEGGPGTRGVESPFQVAWQSEGDVSLELWTLPGEAGTSEPVVVWLQRPKVGRRRRRCLVDWTNGVKFPKRLARWL